MTLPLLKSPKTEPEDEPKYTVSYLKSIDFPRCSKYEQLEIKKAGRATPIIDISYGGVSRSLYYKRKFNPEIYQRSSWLTGCTETNSLYCFPCILYGGDSQWTTVGVKDLPHFAEKVKKHEKCAVHLTNVCEFALLGMDIEHIKANIADTPKRNDMVKKNLTLLSQFIDTLIFCAKYQLPMLGALGSGSNEDDALFEDILENVGKFPGGLAHPFLNETLKGSNRSLESVQNKLLDHMLAVCLEEIINEIKSAKYVAIIAEDITDISENAHLMVVFRYHVGGSIIERFWGLFAALNGPQAGSVEEIADIISEQVRMVVQKDRHKLVAQSYNFAGLVSKDERTVHEIVRATYYNACFVHCYDHPLTVIIEKAASRNPEARAFFASLRAMGDYLSAHSNLRLPQDMATYVYENKEALKQRFENVQDCKYFPTVQQATSLIQTLNDDEFNVWLKFFYDIMPAANTLYQKLLNMKLISSRFREAAEEFVVVLQEKQDKLPSIKVEDTLSSKRTRLSESLITPTHMSVSEVCNILIAEIRQRFMCTAYIAAERMFDTPCAFDNNALIHEFGDVHVEVDRAKLHTELRIVHDRKDFQQLKTLQHLFAVISQPEICVNLIQTCNILQIALTMPMVTTDGGRCLTTLARIRQFLRGTKQQHKLSVLGMLSIESSMVANIKNFNEKVIDKFVKNGSWLEFKYQ